MELAAGIRARISGLNGRADLNGKEAEVLHFAEEAGRWAVHVLGTGEGVRVKPANLTPIPTPAEPQEDEQWWESAALLPRRRRRRWTSSICWCLNGEVMRLHAGDSNAHATSLSSTERSSEEAIKTSKKNMDLQIDKVQSLTNRSLVEMALY